MLLRFASVRIFQMASGLASSHTFPEFFSLIKGFELSPIASAFDFAFFSASVIFAPVEAAEARSEVLMIGRPARRRF